jgi:pyridoxamine 5'-phosphate oxidase
MTSHTHRWGALQRSVRVEGRVTKVTAEESDAYFAVRPRGSQLGAWVSDQSTPVANRAELDSKKAQIEARFPATTAASTGTSSTGSNSDVQKSEVPRPPHWGYVLHIIYIAIHTDVVRVSFFIWRVRTLN